MRSSYNGSGNIVAVDEHTLLIEPKMPGPLCALPRNEAGKTTWSYYTFPLAAITVPLEAVDDSLIGEDAVFTDPEAARLYKPGDVGDSTMVVIVTVPGKQFHALTYDREKLTHLGPGPHSSSAYDQAPDDVMAFGLTFADHGAARAFVQVLRRAVALARAQAAAGAQSGH